MPKIVKIYTENDLFQNIETLQRNRDKRNKLKQFFFEGVRNINNAFEYNWPLHGLVYSRERKLSSWAQEKLNSSKAKFHYELSDDLMNQLSNKEAPSELIGIAEIPEDDLARIAFNKNFLTVVFDRPASPGNLGTIIRSCDALGASGLIITGHAVDVYDPETINAATGSLFALPVVRKPSQKELLPWFQQIKNKLGKFQIVGSDENADKLVYEHDFKIPTILLVGNETAGLSNAYKEISDTTVKIPMQGSASSLNVANATSILLYEAFKQRTQ